MAWHDLDLPHQILKLGSVEATDLLDLVPESSGDQLLNDYTIVSKGYFGILLKVVQLQKSIQRNLLEILSLIFVILRYL
mgnify:CR=1 FL=1